MEGLGLGLGFGLGLGLVSFLRRVEWCIQFSRRFSRSKVMIKRSAMGYANNKRASARL